MEILVALLQYNLGCTLELDCFLGLAGFSCFYEILAAVFCFTLDFLFCVFVQDPKACALSVVLNDNRE